MYSLKSFSCLKFAKTIGLGYLITFISFLIMIALCLVLLHIHSGIIEFTLIVYLCGIFITSFFDLVFIIILFLDIIEILEQKKSKKELITVPENTNNDKNDGDLSYCNIFYIIFYFIVSALYPITMLWLFNLLKKAIPIL